MNYSLSNMLGRGGSFNPNGLMLDMQFALDKTLVPRKGATPTFTRASTGTFVGSNGLIQTAAINSARFNHNPATLVCNGLLIEESRTNLITHSENISDASWLKAAVSAAAPVVTSNVIASPDGATTADKIDLPSVSGVGAYSIIYKSFSQTAGTAYRISVYLRGVSGGERVSLMWTPNGSTYSTLQCVLTTSWQRFDVGYTSTAGSNFVQIGVDLRDAGQTSKSAQSFYMWGAQLEAGAFPTSYIPTTTTSVVRSADVCSISGASFSSIYKSTEGSFLVNASTPASGDRTVLAVDDNTANEMIRLRTESTNPFFKVTDGGVEVVAIDPGTITANTLFKLIGAYKLNDFASSIGGAAVVTDTTGTIPTVDRMRIGAGQAGNTMCGHVASIQYFNKRLTNAKLQSLTA